MGEVEVFGYTVKDPSPSPSFSPSSHPSTSPSSLLTTSKSPSSMPSLSPSYSNFEYINQVDTLLTNGRLGHENKATLQAAYAYVASKSDEETAQRAVQQLIATSPGFHSTSSIDRKNGRERLPSPKAHPADVDYKAIVVLNLFGGVDSFNILAPQNGNDCADLYTEYREARGSAGMVDKDLLSINATGSNQPCTDFGVHRALQEFQTIYNEGNGAFLANFGHLFKPVTKKDWLFETKTDLFSHYTMNQDAQRVDAFQEVAGTGVLGRLLDVMEEKKNMTVGPISINTQTVMLDGKPEIGRLVDTLPANGGKEFDFETDLQFSNELVAAVEELNGDTK
eukprot:1186710-Ditylum_brightwellii.AAC.1